MSITVNYKKNESKKNSSQLALFVDENFNLLDLKNCREFIFDNKPDWIINAAAFTAVDLAEDQEEKCILVNSEGPREIAKALKKINGKISKAIEKHLLPEETTQHVGCITEW